MTSRGLVEVSNLRKVKGRWHAIVTLDGVSRAVDYYRGYWRITPGPKAKTYRQVHPEVAAALAAAYDAEKGIKQHARRRY